MLFTVSCVPLRAFNIAFRDFSAKVNTLSVKRTCQRLILNERKIQRDRIGLQKCLRWGCAVLTGVLSASRMLPLWSGERGSPAVEDRQAPLPDAFREK